MKQLADKPFVLLGVNSDEDREALKQTMVDEQITWRSWWDEGNVEGPIHTTWQIQERPAIHILDANGVIRYKNLPPEEVDAAIGRLLAELEKR
ncbi:MAG: hypothetical protein O3C40_12765 [Planctomycetota bacterium]|nr:hypothetical protein [Planctomycetota bacterium]